MTSARHHRAILPVDFMAQFIVEVDDLAAAFNPKFIGELCTLSARLRPTLAAFDAVTPVSKRRGRCSDARAICSIGAFGISPTLSRVSRPPLASIAHTRSTRTCDKRSGSFAFAPAIVTRFWRVVAPACRRCNAISTSSGRSPLFAAAPATRDSLRPIARRR